MLDASVALAWCFEDEGEGALEALERARTQTVLVPAVWPFEVANALIVAERRKRLTPAEAGRFLELLAALDIEIEAPPSLAVLPVALALAREHGLAIYDASYLELALRRGTSIATLDVALARAAVAAGIAVI